MRLAPRSCVARRGGGGLPRKGPGPVGVPGKVRWDPASPFTLKAFAAVAADPRLDRPSRSGVQLGLSGPTRRVSRETSEFRSSEWIQAWARGPVDNSRITGGKEAGDRWPSAWRCAERE